MLSEYTGDIFLNFLVYSNDLDLNLALSLFECKIAIIAKNVFRFWELLKIRSN